MMANGSRFKNYLAGLSTGAFRMVVHVLVGLWLAPFTLRYLDREEFAIFTLTMEVLTWLALLDIGITAGLKMQAARLSGQPHQEKVNRLASTAFFAQNVIMLVVLVVGAGLTFVFPDFFSIRPSLQKEASMVMMLCVLAAAITIGSQTFSALLLANQQAHVDNLIGLLLIVIRTVVTVVLLKAGWGVCSLAVAHLAARIVTIILAVFRVYRVLPHLQIRYRLASWADFREIGVLGLWFSLTGIAAIVTESLDSVLTAKIISLDAVTILVLTSRPYELAAGFVLLVSENARPMLGQLLGQNKMARSLSAYRQLFAFSAGLAVVSTLSVWAGNAVFVARWVGNAQYAGTLVDLALAFGVVAALWTMPNRIILAANLTVRGESLARMSEGILKLGLAVGLGMKFGLAGIVAANFIAAALTSMWLLPLLTARMFGHSFWEFIWKDAARVVLLLVMLMPIAYASRTIAQDVSGYGGAALAAALTGVPGLVLVWMMMLDKSVRARFSMRHLYSKACDTTLKMLYGSSAR